jgi:hypothetical protein
MRHVLDERQANPTVLCAEGAAGRYRPAIRRRGGWSSRAGRFYSAAARRRRGPRSASSNAHASQRRCWSPTTRSPSARGAPLFPASTRPCMRARLRLPRRRAARSLLLRFFGLPRRSSGFGLAQGHDAVGDRRGRLRCVRYVQGYAARTPCRTCARLEILSSDQRRMPSSMPRDALAIWSWSRTQREGQRDRCRTPGRRHGPHLHADGRAAAARWLGRPLRDDLSRAPPPRRHRDAAAPARLPEALREELAAIADLERILARIALGSARPRGPDRAARGPRPAAGAAPGARRARQPAAARGRRRPGRAPGAARPAASAPWSRPRRS